MQLRREKCLLAPQFQVTDHHSREVKAGNLKQLATSSVKSRESACIPTNALLCILHCHIIQNPNIGNGGWVSLPISINTIKTVSQRQALTQLYLI